MTSEQKGFTLVEIMLYTVLLIFFSAVAVTFLLYIVKLYVYTQVTSEVLVNAQSAMEIMVQEIKQSRSIYTPTSIFDAHPGQLSLETPRNMAPEENQTYVDFYIDDERLYMKREGSAAKLIIGNTVRVDTLTFKYLNPSQAEAVQITLTVSYDNTATGPPFQSPVTLVSTVSPRVF